MRVTVAVSALVATVVLSTRDAHAQRALSAEEIALRTQTLSMALDREEVPSMRWRWGWSLVLGGLTAGNLVRSIVAHALVTNDAPAGWLATTGSALGLLNMLLFPPRAQFAARELRASLRHTDRAPIERMREGERLLRETARNQDFTISPASVAMRMAVPIAMGLVLELGYQLHTASILNVAGGIALGQITIRTAPTAAIDAWQRYVRRWPDAYGGPLVRQSQPLASLAITVRAGGVLVGGTF